MKRLGCIVIVVTEENVMMIDNAIHKIYSFEEEKILLMDINICFLCCAR